MLRSSSALLAVLLVGCAGKAPSTAPETAAPPTVEAVQAPEPGPEPEPAAPCASDDDCAEQGEALEKSGDLEGAVALYQVGCDANGPRSCGRWASAVADEDEALASSLWEKACGLDDPSACFNAAEQVREQDAVKASGLYAKACRPDGDDAMLLSLACGRGALTAYGVEEFDHARAMAEAICTDSLVGGCGLLGVLYAQGAGVSPDLDKAKAYLDQGCKGGDQEACDNLGKLDAAVERDRVASAPPVEGANVSIGAITVDGLSASDLQCRREGGGGLFGGAMGAISGISKRKKKLMKCASAPEDVRVRWTASGGKIKTVEVQASSPKVEACVKKSVKGASAAFGGTCAATFSIGG